MFEKYVPPRADDGSDDPRSCECYENLPVMSSALLSAHIDATAARTENKYKISAFLTVTSLPSLHTPLTHNFARQFP